MDYLISMDKNTYHDTFKTSPNPVVKLKYNSRRVFLWPSGPALNPMYLRSLWWHVEDWRKSTVTAKERIEEE